MSTLKQRYLDRVNKLIQDKLGGKSRYTWQQIANNAGMDRVTLYRHRVKNFPDYNDKFITDKTAKSA